MALAEEQTMENNRESKIDSRVHEDIIYDKGDSSARGEEGDCEISGVGTSERPSGRRENWALLRYSQTNSRWIKNVSMKNK